MTNQNIFLGILFYLTMLSVAHADIYQCDDNGKLSYSQSTCKPGDKETQRKLSSENDRNAANQATEQLKKDKAESKQLENKRHKDEAKHEKEMRQLAAKAEKKKEKCDYLHMQEKWAGENLSNASPKTENQLRQKLKRAKEKADFFCKQ